MNKEKKEVETEGVVDQGTRDGDSVQGPTSDVGIRDGGSGERARRLRTSDCLKDQGGNHGEVRQGCVDVLGAQVPEVYRESDFRCPRQSDPGPD